MNALTDRTYLWRVIVLISLLSSTSCKKEITAPIASHPISFSVEDAWPEQVSCERMSGYYEAGELSGGVSYADSLWIISVSELDRDGISPTKGVPFTTDNIEEFFVYSYTEDDAPYMEEQLVERNGNIWEYEPVKYWTDGTLDFYAYAISRFNRNNVRNVSCSADRELGNYNMSFYYSLPPSDIYQSVDAEYQSDLIFVIKPDCTREQGSVDLQFKHLLSSILFQTGDVPDGTVRVNYIELSNIYGRCNISINYKEDNGLSYGWNYVGQPYETYSQSFLDIDGDGGNDNIRDNQFITVDPWKTFLMIPQDFTEEAAINVSISVDGVNRPIYSIPLAEVHQDKGWLPGKQYIYTLNFK